jgi:L-Ala-D/L-Glu epimerase
VKIAAITAEPWEVPMRSPYRSAQRITTTAHNVLVRVRWENGTEGYGESAPATYVTGETQESVVAAIRIFAAQTLSDHGTDAETLFDALYQFPATAPGASGAVEMALWDAIAKERQLPLYRVLGGTAETPTERFTDLSLPILPSHEAADRAMTAYAQGFTAFKIKVGSGNADEDTERVRAVAEAAPKATLRLDGNQGFTASEALAFAERLADLAPRIEMFEQPTRAGDDAAMYEVQQRVPYPVFADESAHDADEATRLLEHGICGGIVLKLAKSGVSGVRTIARATHQAGGICLFGCMMETRLAISAALHITLALGSEIVPLLDLDGHLLVNDTDLLSGGFHANGPKLTASPNVPGLGITLNSA